jgi:hypothetical protein
LKDIAIYKLLRVERALERLGTAVLRLEAATEGLGTDSAHVQDVPAEGEQFELIQAELDAVRADYEVLRSAATNAANRIEEKIETLDNVVQGATA